MTEIITRSDMKVVLVDHMGDDASIVRAARVTDVSNSWPKNSEPAHDAKLINYLMQHRHGTPFEHATMTFYIEAPIFVWREFHRHRIGFSYNETSARYKPMKPEFWVPREDRPMIPVKNWKPMRPKFKTLHEYAVELCLPKYGVLVVEAWGDNQENAYSVPPENQEAFDKDVATARKIAYGALVADMMCAYRTVWEVYEQLQVQELSPLALEVARTVLPVGIYSSCYVTCNPRSLMHFLGLRVHDPDASFVSYPQAEIEEVAKKMEAEFAVLFPETHKAFVAHKRTAP